MAVFFLALYGIQCQKTHMWVPKSPRKGFAISSVRKRYKYDGEMDFSWRRSSVRRLDEMSIILT
jgi:hypothetical protein